MTQSIKTILCLNKKHFENFAKINIEVVPILLLRGNGCISDTPATGSTKCTAKGQSVFENFNDLKYMG